MKLENSDLENSDFLKVGQHKEVFCVRFGNSEFSNFTWAEVENFDSDWTWTVFQVGLRSQTSAKGQNFYLAPFMAWHQQCFSGYYMYI